MIAPCADDQQAFPGEGEGPNIANMPLVCSLGMLKVNQQKSTDISRILQMHLLGSAAGSPHYGCHMQCNITNEVTLAAAPLSLSNTQGSL